MCVVGWQYLDVGLHRSSEYRWQTWEGNIAEVKGYRTHQFGGPTDGIGGSDAPGR